MRDRPPKQYLARTVCTSKGVSTKYMVPGRRGFQVVLRTLEWSISLGHVGQATIPDYLGHVVGSLRFEKCLFDTTSKLVPPASTYCVSLEQENT